MATENRPGEDSIYVTFKNPGSIQSAISKAKHITTEVADVLERVTMKSRFIWWGDKEIKTKDGNVITEVPKNMLEAQTYFIDNYADNCYDPSSVRVFFQNEIGG